MPDGLRLARSRLLALVILVLSALPTLAAAQSTGSSFGGSRGFGSGGSGSSTGSSGGSGASGGVGGHWSWDDDEVDWDARERQREQEEWWDHSSSLGGDTEYQDDHAPSRRRGRRGWSPLCPLLGIAAFLIVAMGFIGMLVRRLVVGLRPAKESCMACGAIAHPERGRCPSCGGEMEPVV